MNFLKKNWIIASSILIILVCFSLIFLEISSYSYPEGGAGIFLMLGVVFGSKLVFSKINKKFGDKYTRRLDRFFIHIAVPIVIFTSFGLFQKTQCKNAKKEMQKFVENQIQGRTGEKKNYDQMTYGELAPLLQIMNDMDHARAEKEKEYLDGVGEVYDMIKPENLSDRPSRDGNKQKLDILLQGVEKYRSWIHSEMSLTEEKIKKLRYGDTALQVFRKSSETNLLMNDELMDAFCDLIVSIEEIIEFVEEHQQTITLVNGTIEWNNETVREEFAQIFKSMIDSIGRIKATDEKQTEYQQLLLKKINN